mmetsp:Transcript_61321/g.142677  ORF Transcript_61321/g.142677 Transcript_61321/m.142677 type:complete len:305 (-) Transcript_61321:141-1055(-)
MPDVERFSEPLKFLPIVYITATVIGLWAIYTVLHCIPRLQIGVKHEYVDRSARIASQVEIVVFNYFFVLFLVSYAKSILTHPGEVPNTGQWTYQSEDSPDAVSAMVKEKKRSGDRRHCKWCGKYKPDRCHHCRVCRTCILKMDHHCPWIYNCVGFCNYKYFFLVLVYAVLSCQFMFWSMMESVVQSVVDGLPFATMFFLFFAETLALFLSVLLGAFGGFHVWLMFNAMTTIEYCEKSLPNREEDGHSSNYSATQYSRGFFGNICAVLGDNPLAWFLPFARPAGDGLIFETQETPLLPRRTTKAL